MAAVHRFPDMQAEPASAEEENPVLDVGPYLGGEAGARQRLAREVGYALENIGFFYIRNHGVSQALIDRVFAENARFHALPLERKLQIRVNESGIGYMPTGLQQVKSFEGQKANKPDIGEAFFMTREGGQGGGVPEAVYRGANQWPADLPGFRETLIEYFSALEALSLRLLPVYATALGLPPEFFDPAFSDNKATGILRLSHYPSIEIEENQFNTAPHVDGDFITFLAQSRVPGLHIRTRSRKWIQAPVLPGTLLVNSGEILRVWSNDRFLATPHRVINSGGRERYAIPFFYLPHPETLIECLPTCQGPNNPPRYQAITVHAYTDWFAKENFLHLQSRAGRAPY
ncbi:MAG TPA: 2-oxoglutarate and iron-dependent oxygenase domain-containing protein [Candidatus Binatia bacterium]|nr:2-oxoglutarate and iron-dependent oxygenase domain-containing protein [Candidatus Binatia bacterium]